jgi:hypothetical protein
VFYWIYDYPTWSMGASFAAVFVTVTWLGIFLLRSTVVSWLHAKRPANDIVGLGLSSFSVPFQRFSMRLSRIGVRRDQPHHGESELPHGRQIGGRHHFGSSETGATYDS